MDDQDDDDAQYEAAQAPGDGQPRWRKPALLFTVALVSGALASGLWLKLHPRPVATLPSDAAVALDPAHRTLPAPMAGGSTNLPPPATPSPDAPHLVSTAPDAASAADSTAVDVAAGGAETEQAMASPESPATPADNDTGPQVVERFPPPYPPEALRERMEGVVHLTVSIDAQGNIAEASVAHSSGSTELDRAAVDAVRSWHYRPAMRDGQAVPGTIEVPVDFKLEAQQ